VPELIFTVAEDSPPAYGLLASALRDAVLREDADAELLSSSTLPPPRPDRVYVLVGTPANPTAAPTQDLKRTIAISAALPGSAAWEATLALAPRVAITLHPNHAATQEIQASGCWAGHLQLGYEPSWDRFDPAAEPELEVIRAPAEPAYFDWVAALAAIHSGAVVLHERAISTLPLIPGRHIYIAARESLPAVAEALRAEPERLRQTAAEAHDFIARLLRMDIGAAALLGHSRGLVVQPIG
jgi:hypothetical protein